MGHLPPPPGTTPPEPAGDRSETAELDDLVTLAALACRTPVAVVAVFDDGEPSTLRSYGWPEAAVPAVAALARAIEAREGLVELRDLPADLPGFEWAAGSMELRWACGVAVGRPGHALRAAVAVAGPRYRELTGDGRAGLMAISRRLHQSLVSGAAIRAAGTVIDLTHPERAGEPGSQVLRSVDVAEIFAVSERTVMKWASEGRIPCFRTAGGRLRFRRDDIAEFIGEHSSMSGYPESRLGRGLSPPTRPATSPASPCPSTGAR